MEGVLQTWNKWWSQTVHRNKWFPASCSGTACGLKGHDRKRAVCHAHNTQQHSTLEWDRLCCSRPLRLQRLQILFMRTHKTSPSLFCPSLLFQYQPALCLKWAVCAFWMMLVTISLHNQESRTEIDQTLSTFRGVNEPHKARLSVGPGAQFVCTVITPTVAVPR